MPAAEGGTSQLYVRWMRRGESARITGLPDSPGSITWSPDGSRIAYSMFIPDDGLRLGSAPPSPRARNGPSRCEIIDAITYRADGAGYFKPGYTQLFWVSGRWRLADPADLRRDQCRRTDQLDPRQPRALVRRQPGQGLDARSR